MLQVSVPRQLSPIVQQQQPLLDEEGVLTLVRICLELGTDFKRYARHILKVFQTRNMNYEKKSYLSISLYRFSGRVHLYCHGRSLLQRELLQRSTITRPNASCTQLYTTATQPPKCISSSLPDDL